MIHTGASSVWQYAQIKGAIFVQNFTAFLEKICKTPCNIGKIVVYCI